MRWILISTLKQGESSRILLNQLITKFFKLGLLLMKRMGRGKLTIASRVTAITTKNSIVSNSKKYFMAKKCRIPTTLTKPVNRILMPIFFQFVPHSTGFMDGFLIQKITIVMIKITRGGAKTNPCDPKVLKI